MHGVVGASGALAEIASAAGLQNGTSEGGGVLLAGSDSVLSSCSARWLESDPARALDAGLPAICAAEWIADLHRALRPDLPAFVVRPGVRNIEHRIGAKRSLRVFGPPEIVTQMKEPHELATREEEAQVVLDLTPSSIVVRSQPTIRALVPGATEAVQHGVNGLLIEPDDPRGAARLLDLVARDTELRERLERGARDREWPTVEESAEKLVEALDAIAAAGATQAEEPRPFLPRAPEHHARPVVERPGLRRLKERLR